jgi:hypothetical protein
MRRPIERDQRAGGERADNGADTPQSHSPANPSRADGRRIIGRRIANHADERGDQEKTGQEDGSEQKPNLRGGRCLTGGFFTCRLERGI